MPAKKRNQADFYPTPLSAFTPILSYIPKLEVWEPSQGDGRLVTAMRAYGLIAHGDDLNNGYNFLQDNKKRECVITNPPFSLALEFCQHALDISDEIFMLLRINFLGSQSRYQWWKLHEPSCLFVLSQRPRFTGNNFDATEYAWFYWGKHHNGIVHLLDENKANKEQRNKRKQSPSLVTAITDIRIAIAQLDESKDAEKIKKLSEVITILRNISAKAISMNEKIS